MSDTKSTDSSKSRRSSRLLRFRKLRLTALIFVLAGALLFVPPVFQMVLRNVIIFEAWQHSATVRIGHVQGSLFDPVTVTNAEWTQSFPDGAVLRVEVASAEADFAWRWRELISGGGGRWFRQLVLDGVTGKLELPPRKSDEHEEETGAASSQPPKERLLKAAWWPAPERFEAQAVDFVIQSNDDYVRLEGSGCVFSQVEPGVIQAKQVAVKQGWFVRTFREVHGTTAIQDSTALIANLALVPGVEVRSLSAELQALAEGRLNAEVQIAAFGGELRAQIATLHDQPGTGIDASGKFSQIGVAPLATFLSLSDAAGGTIKEGQFTFRGKPHNIGHATVSLRLQANNFQWESRQWDSLVLGATLRDRRIEVPDLELHQGPNQLILSGELTLPAPGMEWWQTDFATDLSAHVENLTELSALMLPEFKYAAGRMNIDGEVRGHAQDFHGAVIVSGSNITWRNAPIEDLRAAIRLNGNELRLENLDLLNKDDFVRGRGGINILGAKQYWGEFRASIADLATYSALLQKPIVPEPLAGGAVIDWSGEGSDKGYSGKFFARLNKLRTLGATGAMLHPINADLEGDYAPESMQFSKFAVSDDQSSFTANVKVGNKALSLGSIRLMHGADTWLEGDAVLPLDVWQAWPNASLETLLSDQTPVKAALTAKDLQLHDAAQLTGWKWPVEGVLNGTLTGDGKLGSLVTTGHLTLSKGRIPLDWNGAALTDLQAEVGFDGQKAHIEKMQCTSPEGGKFSTSGEIDFTNVRDPALQLAVQSEQYAMPLFSGLQYRTDRTVGKSPNGTIGELQAALALDLHIGGLLSAATLQGKAALSSLALGGAPDLTAFWLGSNPDHLPPLFNWASAPWANWRLAITCDFPEALPLQGSAGQVQAALKLGGMGAAPALTGTVQVTNLSALTSIAPMSVEQCNLEFRDGFPDDPSIDARASAHVANCDVIAQAAGPLSHCLRFFECEPPLTPEKFRAWLTSPREAVAAASITNAWLQQDPVAVSGNVPVFNWAVSGAAEAVESPPNGAAPPAPSGAAHESIQ